MLFNAGQEAGEAVHQARGGQGRGVEKERVRGSYISKF